MRDTIFSELESESIEIFREVVTTAAKPVILCSIGKDSGEAALGTKGILPGWIPFPPMHINTECRFREMIGFRDRTAAEVNPNFRPTRESCVVPVIQYLARTNGIDTFETGALNRFGVDSKNTV